MLCSIKHGLCVMESEEAARELRLIQLKLLHPDGWCHQSQTAESDVHFIYCWRWWKELHRFLGRKGSPRRRSIVISLGVQKLAQWVSRTSDSNEHSVEIASFALI